MLEVAVIGGGIVGASAAYHLVRHGARVTLVDSVSPGRATIAGAGILPPDDHFAQSPELLPLLRAARTYYPHLRDLLKEDDQLNDFYSRCGALQVARTEAEAARVPALVRQLQQRRATGFDHIGDVQQLTGEEARQLVPALAPDVLSASFAPESARVSGQALLARLRKTLAQRGVRLLQGQARPRVCGGRVDSIEVGGETLRPDRTLISAGCWSGALARELGTRVAVRPQRGQLVHLVKPADPGAQAWPTVLSFKFHYALFLPKGRVISGATREDTSQFACEPTASGVHGLLERTFQLLPGLATAHFDGVRVGLRPVTGDGLPVLGELHGLRDAYIATGHGSYGLETGPVSGALVAQLMLEQRPDVNLQAFSNRRFQSTSEPQSLQPTA